MQSILETPFNPSDVWKPTPIPKLQDLALAQTPLDDYAKKLIHRKVPPPADLLMSPLVRRKFPEYDERVLTQKSLLFFRCEAQALRRDTALKPVLENVRKTLNDADLERVADKEIDELDKRLKARVLLLSRISGAVNLAAALVFVPVEYIYRILGPLKRKTLEKYKKTHHFEQQVLLSMRWWRQHPTPPKDLEAAIPAAQNYLDEFQINYKKHLQREVQLEDMSRSGARAF